jgi:hypothetical protein
VGAEDVHELLAHKVKLRAERRAGELLADDPELKDGRPKGDTMSPLKRLGMSYTSHRVGSG